MTTVPAATVRPQVGVVGLGVMGSAIAVRLLDRLAALHVCDVRAAARDHLAALGAVAHPTPQELARACDVVVLSLNTASVVESVVLGGHGLAAALADDPGRGLLVIDMSSIEPAATRRIAQAAAPHGIAWVDAPLSGGAPRAADGTLTLMLGGADDDVARARDVLRHVATRVTHLGGVGAGQLVKLVNQVLVGASFGALAEAAALVRAEGLAGEAVLAALTGGRADSAVLQEFFLKFVTGDLTPTGRVANMVKDLDGAREHARSLALPLPVTAAVCEVNRWLVQRGHADADNAALVGFYDATALPDTDRRPS